MRKKAKASKHSTKRSNRFEKLAGTIELSKEASKSLVRKRNGYTFLGTSS